MKKKKNEDETENKTKKSLAFSLLLFELLLRAQFPSPFVVRERKTEQPVATESLKKKWRRERATAGGMRHRTSPLRRRRKPPPPPPPLPRASSRSDQQPAPAQPSLARARPGLFFYRTESAPLPTRPAGKWRCVVKEKSYFFASWPQRERSCGVVRRGAPKKNSITSCDIKSAESFALLCTSRHSSPHRA